MMCPYRRLPWALEPVLGTERLSFASMAIARTSPPPVIPSRLFYHHDIAALSNYHGIKSGQEITAVTCSSDVNTANAFVPKSFCTIISVSGSARARS